MLPVKIFKPGERLRVKDGVYTTNDSKYKRVEVKVVKQYSHHVLVKKRSGTRWCITNAELYMMSVAKAGKGMAQDGGKGQEKADGGGKHPEWGKMPSGEKQFGSRREGQKKDGGADGDSCRGMRDGSNGGVHGANGDPGCGTAGKDAMAEPAWVGAGAGNRTV